MMHATTYKDQLADIDDTLIEVLQQLRAVPGDHAAAIDRWEATCRAVRRRLDEEIVRVAVVGAIKSGKSTLVNALLGGDHLRRGAGVITSIVTRLRRGDKLHATLRWKPWEQINGEIQRALTGLPPAQIRPPADGIWDIRRTADRAEMRRVLAAMGSADLISGSQRSAASVRLSSYLDGFERVAALRGADADTLELTADAFERHQAFVAEDALAIYLQDVHLQIDTPALARGVEIADCQGVDAPNPLHTAMIQDYLRSAHLIVYVISSRTGVRRADIGFLTMIKRMGIAANMLFVLNCDLDEHGQAADFQRVRRTVVDDLTALVPAPRLYCLSALHDLLQRLAPHLTPRERQRLVAWRGDAVLTADTLADSRRFEADLRDILVQRRDGLLLHNHLERIATVAGGLHAWVAVHLRLLSDDVVNAERVVHQIGIHRRRLAQVRDLTISALDGSVKQIKATVRSDVDRFFDARGGPVVTTALDFLRDLRAPSGELAAAIGAGGDFSALLVRAYQEFGDALDRFVSQTVNPEVIRFTRQAELTVGDYLAAVARSYEDMVQGALAAYEDALAPFGLAVPAARSGGEGPVMQDMAQLPDASGLSPPTAGVTLNYARHLRTEAVARLGLYSALGLLRRLMKRRSDPAENRRRALNDAMKRLKRQTAQALRSHFIDLRENLKFQYLFKLVEAARDHLQTRLDERLQGYAGDLSGLADMMGQQGAARRSALDTLAQVDETCGVLERRLDRLRDQTHRVLAPPADSGGVSDPVHADDFRSAAAGIV